MDHHLQLFVLDNLTTATLLVDENLIIRYINPATEDLLGMSANRVEGTPLEENLSCISENLRERVRLSILTGQPYAEHEIDVMTPGKKRITVNCTLTPLRESGLPPSLLLEVVSLDRHLRITREDQILRQTLATRALVRGFAHEIKNPLGGLRGAAQLLEGELDDNKGLKEYTRIIIGEADRLRSLVDRMLGPNGLPQKRDVDIHEVLEHVRSLVTAESADSVNLKRDYDPSIPSVYADRNLLIQAILNIVRNALQAVACSGTITLRTRIERQFSVGQTLHRLVAKVDVIDNGPGIPEHLREKLFYPMITGRDQGTGLGLSIAQTLINLHDGLIEYTSEPGHTVFSILIPITNRGSEESNESS
jgi:two-component system nitrogen regulation sensor histidine kinase GlnL